MQASINSKKCISTTTVGPGLITTPTIINLQQQFHPFLEIPKMLFE